MSRSQHKITRRTVLAGAAQAAAVGVVFAGHSPQQGPEIGKDARTVNLDDYVIWDAHGHLGMDGNTPQQRLDSLLRAADRMHVERVIAFMGYPWSYDPDPDEMRRQNDQVLDAVEHSGGRAFGFVYLNPKHTQESVAELDRCVRDGPMVGIKLWVALHCDDERLDPIVERATELKAPVLQHTWRQDHG